MLLRTEYENFGCAKPIVTPGTRIFPCRLLQETYMHRNTCPKGDYTASVALSYCTDAIESETVLPLLYSLPLVSNVKTHHLVHNTCYNHI